jgi:membrane-associated phospholipid phosphatase
VAADRMWSEAMHSVTSAPLDRAALAFDRSGRGVVRGATLAAIGVTLASRARWRGLRAFAAAEAVTPLAVNAVKLVVNRERPARARVDPFGTSFPSGHAAYAGATTVALVLLVADGNPPPLGLWTAAAAGTAGMAWSRTHLQAHWLSDVVAGALLGAGVSLAVFAVIGPRRP